MNGVISRIKSWFKRDDRGASAVEYALIVGLIAAVIGGVIFVLGGRVNFMFDRACDQVSAAGTVTECNPAR